MKNKLVPNRFVSVLSIGLVWVAAVGFTSAPAPVLIEDNNAEFIPIVVRASAVADYGTDEVKVVIAPVQLSAVASVLADRGADQTQVEQIISTIEQQIQETPAFDEGTSSIGPNGAGPVAGQASASGLDFESNSDQIPGEGNAYGYDNGNAYGHDNQNANNQGGNGLALGQGNGNGPDSNNGLALGQANGNNGQGNSSNNGNANGQNNGNGNGNGVGLEVSASDGEIEVEIDLGNGNNGQTNNGQHNGADNSNANNGNANNGNANNGNGNNN